MKKIIRNTFECFGELSGLKPKDWQAEQDLAFQENKAGLKLAAGWMARLGTERHDPETAMLETKIFLYEVVDTAPADGPLNLTQRAAQELLDELHGELVG